MADDDEASQGEVLEDLRAILGDGPVPFPVRQERSFKPWHRPRKQYVRNAQWAKEIDFLIRDMGLDGSDLRYLTLPGSDMLDIRHLVGAAGGQRGVRLRYLGFNTAGSATDSFQPDLNAAQFSLNRLDSIHPESEVFPGDFRLVGDPRSVPWQRVRRAGPFHAINLDLCGGFAGHEKAEGIPNYFAALKALLQHQQGSDQDFLLFITTRMDEDSVDAQARLVLDELAQTIHDTCAEYAAGFAEAWEMASSDEPMRAVSAAELFMLGLTQWIVSESVTAGFRASVKSFMTYRTGDGVGEDDIVSFAIRFKPDPYIQPDAVGLVRLAAANRPLKDKQCEQSARIPSRVRGRVSVDELLRTEADEAKRCIEETSDLLGAAGYDVGLYRDWVLQEPDRYATA